MQSCSSLSCCCKQVEINTIASGFGWLGPASTLIHRSVWHEEKNENLPNKLMFLLCVFFFNRQSTLSRKILSPNQQHLFLYEPTIIICFCWFWWNHFEPFLSSYIIFHFINKVNQSLKQQLLNFDLTDISVLALMMI